MNVEIFMKCQQRVEQGLAADLAASASGAKVKCFQSKVIAQLFFVAPSLKKKIAIITKVTADNFSSCYALWKESKVFEFCSTFKTFFSNPESTASSGIRL